MYSMPTQRNIKKFDKLMFTWSSPFLEKLKTAVSPVKSTKADTTSSLANEAPYSSKSLSLPNFPNVGK